MFSKTHILGDMSGRSMNIVLQYILKVPGATKVSSLLPDSAVPLTHQEDEEAYVAFPKKVCLIPLTCPLTVVEDPGRPVPL